MPFFKKVSADDQRKLEHKLYLAKESPDATFDVSECRVYEIPSGIFSLCKVLRKEALILFGNHFSSLKGGGSLSELSSLRVLDLHDNEFSSLPEEIGELQNLQVLNLASNKLKELPSSIGKLKVLQTLNVRDNKLKVLPETLCQLSRLRTLDVSGNHITALPKKLCNIRTLDTLIVTASDMKMPPADICNQGAETIMKYLCSECGIEYIPPSKVLLDQLDSPLDMETKWRKQSLRAMEEENLKDTLQHYQSLKDKKREQATALERALREEQEQQAQLAVLAASKRDDLIRLLAEDENKRQGEFTKLTQQKEEERQKLVATLYQVEQGASELINNILEMNEKARRTEEILEQMEKERMELEQWLVVHQEEEENLRKQEVLVNMERMLQENENFENMRQMYLAQRQEVAQRAQQSVVDADSNIENLLVNKDMSKKEFLEQLIREEKWQKEAFESLLLQKDSKHQRISSQIELIERELMQMTLVEMERRDVRIDSEKNMLTEKRQELSKMLVQLIEEKEHREEQIKNRLLEMEQAKLDNQMDYWLVQYQRLMDRKPDALINQEIQLEYAVENILREANASDYIPLFARHRISIETMEILTEEDMCKMGVTELGIRKAIIKAIQEYQDEQQRAAKKTKDIEKTKDAEPSESQEADAAIAPPSAGVTPSAPPVTELIARVTSDCVVCMDSRSEMIFMNCGHVCCCKTCSESLPDCPLCRQKIVQKIRLTQG